MTQREFISEAVKMFPNNKIVATIEARMTSSRFPGKVLMDFCGKPSLQHIIERLRRSKYIDDVIVATTVNKEDDPIVNLCKSLGCRYYRGSEDDVLDRVLKTAKSIDGDVIVEITGDCPLIDWRHADFLIKKLFESDYDYSSNIIERTFPDGFDVQVFYTSVLEEVSNITQDPSDREHVSLYIYNHPGKYKLYNWSAPEKLHYPQYAVTLDTIEDYELIKLIYENLYYKNPDFDAHDVVEFLLHNQKLLDINNHIERKGV